MIVNTISSSRYKIDKKKIKNIIKEIAVKKNASVFSCLNFIFIGRRKMKFLTKKYKKEENTLPILTFYYNEKNIGEIFICYPLMILLAAEKNKTVDYILNFLIQHALENIIKQKELFKNN